MRSRVCEALRDLDAQPIEIGQGIPDVNHRFGWIELKVIPSWPVREATVVACPKFYQGQRVWIRRRQRAGGSAEVLLLVARTDDWLLLPGAWAANHLGIDATRDHLLANSIKSWEGGLDDADLLEVIRKIPP